MSRFTNTSFQTFSLSELPHARDIFMMDEIYMDEWEAENIKRFEGRDNADPYGVGYITPVHISGITAAGADLSWYPNTHDRFHEVKPFFPAVRLSQQH